ncbi:MAG: tRNA (adenosine(37)-N6)-dimethylallyltransferase MiaA [Rhodococcus sp. (in: high G+C Gram-positive bacteria)]
MGTVSVNDAIVPVAVVGPTATGKSGLALDLAERLGGHIVNIDAMQQYRGMDIGTAKTPVSERRGIVHHLFDVLDVTETATVAVYQEAAVELIDSLLARSVVPVIVGGSMMYIQALLDGWQFPATDPALRVSLEERLAAEGVAALHSVLANVDPAAAASILPTDGRRIVRALEVVELTGKPFAASAPTIGEPRWDTVILGIDRDTEHLDARISARTDTMFSDGLVDEVQDLAGRGLREGVTARRAIGYAQVLDLIDGKTDEVRAREDTFVGTRRYVRRQRSWFARDARIQWLRGEDPGLTDSATTRIEAAVKGSERQ